MMNMNMMNDPALAGMLPFDPMQFYEPPKPRYIFKMPRVVPNQKEKFESDDLFKRLHRDGEVRYTGFRDRPIDERQLRFQTGCREGHTEISFVASGTNIQLIFNPGYHHHHHHPAYVMERECDFDKEIGKVSFQTVVLCVVENNTMFSLLLKIFFYFVFKSHKKNILFYFSHKTSFYES
jgi:hypothetical protein